MKKPMKKYGPIVAPIVATAMSCSLLSGCIVATGVGAPLLFVTGTIFTWTGFIGSAATYYNRSRHARKLHRFFGTAFLIGLILDEKNPGRMAAVNELPIDDKVADALGVKPSDLEQYNHELNQVIRTNNQIEVYMKQAQDSGASGYDAILDSYATANGLGTGAELKEVMMKDSLSGEKLKAFASANSLSENTAKIFLKTRFSIKIDN
jgi:hypothetical protein